MTRRRPPLLLLVVRWLAWGVAVVAVQVLRDRDVRWRVSLGYLAADRALRERLHAEDTS